MAEHKLRIDVKLGTKQAQQETKKLSDSFSGVKRKLKILSRALMSLTVRSAKKQNVTLMLKKQRKKLSNSLKK